MRAYPLWAIIFFVLGWTVIAATLAIVVDLLFPFLTIDPFGLEFMLATVGSAATIGIAAGLALIAIAGAGRRDGKIGRWKLWAKLLLLLGAVPCICIPLLMVAAGQFGSIFAEMLLFFGWIPMVIGAVLIVASLIWGRRR